MPLIKVVTTMRKKKKISKEIKKWFNDKIEETFINLNKKVLRILQEFKKKLQKIMNNVLRNK